MADLDDKLREIISKQPYEYYDGELVLGEGAVNETTRLIKQAFKDAGYLKEIDVSIPATTPYIRSAWEAASPPHNTTSPPTTHSVRQSQS